MKKINLFATLAMLTLSAIPVMAHQLDLPSTEILKDTKAALKNTIKDIRTTTATIAQDYITESLDATIELAERNNETEKVSKYNVLLKNYRKFLSLMDDKSLAGQPGNIVDQKILTTIDDLAASLLSLEENGQEFYRILITRSEYDFQYTGRKVNLQKLFNSSKNYGFTQGNTAIEKLLDQVSDEQVVKQIETDINKEVYKGEPNGNVYKYFAFLNEYNRFLNSMNNEFVSKANKELVGQFIYVTLDDLGRAFTKLPAEAQNRYKELLNKSTYNFKYDNKNYTLQELLKLAQNLKPMNNNYKTEIENILQNNNVTISSNTESDWLENFVKGAQATK